MKPPESLNAYRAAGVIGRDDIAAATLLVEMAGRDGAPEPEPLGWLGLCLALRTVRDGHTCVDFGVIEAWRGEIDPETADSLPWPPDAAAWIAPLEKAAALVGKPGDRRPFILDGHRLYLARALAEEASIAAAITARAARRTIRILLGGPGTGKTTRVAQDLVRLFEDAAKRGETPSVGLAAPTGKAAARMAEAIQKACASDAVKASRDVIDAILQLKPTTVHKLLGANPSRGDRYTYDARARLPFKLVIVDEASMLSSSLLHHLLAAVADDAALMLVGDPDQLASVDAGTALGDIALFGRPEHAGTPLYGCIETLTTCHRTESKDILAIAHAIREGKPDQAIELLRPEGTAVTWVDPAEKKKLEAVTKQVVEHARRLRTLAHGTDAKAVLETQRELQVLCAHREGPMSVADWNRRVEKQLDIRPGFPWYSGRPVMITRNSPSLRLANGDVGVVMSGRDIRIAAFGITDAEHRPLELPVSRLEDIETVHALTIHKSQGSEYGHAVVVLPERAGRIVTRELLYTAITRASKRVTVVGSRDVIEAAIKTPIRRATGLASRLV
jgi:exodeoxyribonuclease V alpha subunit